MLRGAFEWALRSLGRSSTWIEVSELGALSLSSAFSLEASFTRLACKPASRSPLFNSSISYENGLSCLLQSKLRTPLSQSTTLKRPALRRRTDIHHAGHVRHKNRNSRTLCLSCTNLSHYFHCNQFLGDCISRYEIIREKLVKNILVGSMLNWK